MNKVLFVVAFVLVATSVAALHGFVKDPAYAELNLHKKGVDRVTNFDPRVQHEMYIWQAVVKLEPLAPPIVSRGSPILYPRGVARVYNAKYGTNIHSGIQKLSVTEMIPSFSRDYIFEVWLVDNETNYWLSLGVFDTIGRGTGMIEMRKGNWDLNVYDDMVITREPFPDNSPAHSDEIILRGSIRHRAPLPYEVNETSYTRLWGVNTYFK